MHIDEFERLLDGVQHHSNGQRSARCPAHDDQVASLSFREGEHAAVVVHCHAGCALPDICAAVDIRVGDLAGDPHIVAEYPYVDAAGQLLYTVERWQPKDFRCRPRLPSPAQRVLYNLGDVLATRSTDAPVYIVEGEKDVETLKAMGVVATCNVGGAGKWLAHYTESLINRDVIIIADNNLVGVNHARTVARSVAYRARSVKLMRCRFGVDITECAVAGFGLEVLEPLPEGDGDLGALRSANVQIKPVLWAWDGFIPFGKITLIEGDPGDGKSLLTIDLIARWTSGAPMPDGQAHNGPFTAVMISSEDDPEDTVVPRLLAAGADRERVLLVMHGLDEHLPFDLSADIATLEAVIRAHNARILVIDPLMASMGGTDTHADAEVRRALFGLYRLARDTGVAVLLVRHLNKGGSGPKAIYRGGGSIGFVGAARAAFNLGRDPDDPERRVLAPVKMNLAASPPSLAYTIEQGSTGPFIAWKGIVSIGAQALVDAGPGVDREEVAEIIEFLDNVVEETPMTWREIVNAGRREGFTERRLRERRKHSRLVKITGSEGARSVRWGYLRHRDAKQDQVSDLIHSTPVVYSHLNGEMGKRENGQSDLGSTTQSDNPVRPFAHLPNFQALGNGRSVDQIGHAAATESDEHEQRLSEILARPLICDICGTTDGVCRFEHPWWVIRCPLHNPLAFHGGNDESHARDSADG